MNNVNTDLWLISYFSKSENKKCYGLRQTSSPEYSTFYAWTRHTSYRCITDDMPWDYFTFDQPADETEFLRRYGSMVTPDSP